MRRYLSLYGWFVRLQVRAWMQYRLNFLIGAGSTVILQGTGVLTLWIVMRQIPSIRGWTFDQVVLIYGLIAVAEALGRLIADNLWPLGHIYVLPGDFDRFLLRPVDTLFYVLAERFTPDGVGDLLVGSTLVAHSLAVLGIVWTPLQALAVVTALVSGAGIFVGINIITGSTVFWLGDAAPVMGAVYELKQFARYPLTIYDRSIRILMTWLVPYGLVSFYPAGYLLHQRAGGYVLAAPAVAAALLLLGYRVWTLGLRHYSSTGS